VHTIPNDYEWDANKAASNFAKHGVDFAHAVAALEDEGGLTLLDDGSGEERYISFGLDPNGRLLAVAYTWREGVIRIISARKATRAETRFYAETNP
jgi:uncharacterized DUF497 family protein